MNFIKLTDQMNDPIVIHLDTVTTIGMGINGLAVFVFAADNNVTVKESFEYVISRLNFIDDPTSNYVMDSNFKPKF